MTLKAHDVRHLTVCTHCGGIGDDRDMVRTGSGLVHGRCAHELLGVDGLLRLPKAELGKIRLDDVGADIMKRLI